MDRMFKVTRNISQDKRDALKVVDAKMAKIQSKIDILDGEVQEAVVVVHAIQDKIRVIRPKLVPLAEEKVRIVKG